MKKLLLFISCLLLISSSAFAFDCENVWENIPDNSYKINEEYYVTFSESFKTDCPKGCAEIFDNELVEPVFTCPYETVNKDMIKINCNGSTLYFLLYDKYLLLLEPDDFLLTRIPKADEASNIDAAVEE